ncbi:MULTISPECIES: Rv2629 family ribosome hibernation factor [Prauserella salsuginis group]|uniref:Peptide subunit release factor 1 (ERF1) n=2 Tax=Prauserella salsuginis group TaxID=2893672 RepID=A0A839XL92_9PSEU|nr:MULTISPECIES: Vms1/Ankzf1 family peptidyl-tRNA hydrolase [Prauserella salsuginis group]MBB3664020.1 peptide subunit release factor 1 (eRF1) [Prauserella sediminis]MCR3721475.1 Peptide chain release factor 1 (eRF1) [Prauserella flava]MCR3732465.1 Peptide chain release factor 1 (eRF1) [Prauserella salsuginis]
MRRNELQDVLAAEGPFACAYFDASHDTEDAADRIRLQWRSVREQLTEQGADQATVDAMNRAVSGGEPPVGTAGRALIGAGGDLLVDEWLPSPPQTVARRSEVPYLLPLLATMDRPVPYVAVIADRTEARLKAVDHSGEPVATEDVSGEDYHVHKPRGGGWSHRRIQQYAEESVKRNARDMADEADLLAQKVSARLVAIGGEAQTRSALRDELSPRCAEIAVELNAGPAEGEPDLDEYDAWLDELVARQQAEDRDDIVQRYRAAAGRDEGASGLRAVTAALRDGRVATLLVDRGGLGDGTVLWGEDLLRVATAEDGLSEQDVSEHRADEALPAAAIAAGADVLVVDGVELPDGVGALLRY